MRPRSVRLVTDAVHNGGDSGRPRPLQAPHEHARGWRRPLSSSDGRLYLPLRFRAIGCVVFCRKSKGQQLVFSILDPVEGKGAEIQRVEVRTEPFGLSRPMETRSPSPIRTRTRAKYGF